MYVVFGAKKERLKWVRESTLHFGGLFPYSAEQDKPQLYIDKVRCDPSLAARMCQDRFLI